MEQKVFNNLNEAIADAKQNGDLTQELIFELIGKVLCGERMTLEEMIKYLDGKDDKKKPIELFPHDLEYNNLYLVTKTDLIDLYDKLLNRGPTGDPPPDTVAHPLDFDKYPRLTQPEIDKIVEEELAKQKKLRMTQEQIDALLEKLKEQGILKLDTTRETVSEGIKILEKMHGLK